MEIGANSRTKRSCHTAVGLATFCTAAALLHCTPWSGYCRPRGSVCSTPAVLPAYDVHPGASIHRCYRCVACGLFALCASPCLNCVFLQNLKREGFRGLTNPYCQLSVGRQGPYTTDVVFDSVNPSWEHKRETFEFRVSWEYTTIERDTRETTI